MKTDRNNGEMASLLAAHPHLSTPPPPMPSDRDYIRACVMDVQAGRRGRTGLAVQMMDWLADANEQGGTRS